MRHFATVSKGVPTKNVALLPIYKVARYLRSKTLKGEFIMQLIQPLPTIFYPLSNRCNWRYWYKLSNDSYVTRDFQTVTQCLKMYKHCSTYNIEFKASPKINWHTSCSLLNLFFKRLSDRKQKIKINKKK